MLAVIKLARKRFWPLSEANAGSSSEHLVMSKALESKREMGRVLWEGSVGSARHEGRSEMNSSPDVRLFVKAES